MRKRGVSGHFKDWKTFIQDFYHCSHTPTSGGPYLPFSNITSIEGKVAFHLLFSNVILPSISIISFSHKNIIDFIL